MDHMKYFLIKCMNLLLEYNFSLNGTIAPKVKN